MHYVEPHPLHEPVRQVELEPIIQELWEQVDEVNGGNTARTLVKQDMFRIVLIAVKKGARIPEHKLDGECSVQLLSGHAYLDFQGDRRELRPGQILAIDTGIRHDVEALEDTCLLLTISMLR
jgi:quercetin dioxygenase-like cupin family protein